MTDRSSTRTGATAAEVDETLQLRPISLATFKAHLPRRRTVFQVISISVVVVLVADRDPGALRLQTVRRKVRDPAPFAADADLHRLHSAPRRRRSRPRRSRRKTQPPRIPPGLRAHRRPATTFPASSQIDVYTRPFTHPTGAVSIAAGARRASKAAASPRWSR